jgi:hypothetical protein
MQPLDCVGVANPAGTVPDWRAVASIQLDRKLARAALILRHVPAYKDFEQHQLD